MNVSDFRNIYQRFERNSLRGELVNASNKGRSAADITDKARDAALVQGLM